MSPSIPPTPADLERLAGLLRHELTGAEIVVVPSAYSADPRGAVRVRLGHRAFLDLADDGASWFVAGLWADQGGETPPGERRREFLAVPLQAEAPVVATAVVASVWRWVEAIGAQEADAPFTRTSRSAPPAIPGPAAFGAPAPAPYAPQASSTPPAGAWPGYPAPNAYVPHAAPVYGAAPPHGAWPPAAPSRPRNRGLLIGGIVAASVLVLGGISAAVVHGVGSLASEVVAGSAPGVDPDAVPDTGIEELTVGDCFSFGAADASADQVSMVDLRSCDEDHQNEVFLQDELSGTAAYPGDDETAVEADDLCYGAFEGYVGLPWEESEVDYLYLTPTEESWSEGDHSVLCYVYLYGDTSPGSLQDYGY